MEPNQNINNTQNMAGVGTAPSMTGVTAAPSAPVASSQSGGGVVFQDKPKSGRAMLYGMIVLAILAIGGIGFGVWAMMDGNAQKDQLNSQVASLKQQNASLQKQIDELQATVEMYESGTGIATEIVAPQWGEAEAVIVEGEFTIKNADGDIYTQLDGYEVTEIVSCDSGTGAEMAPMTCIVKTPEGEAKIIYNYDEHSLEYITTNE